MAQKGTLPVINPLVEDDRNKGPADQLPTPTAKAAGATTVTPETPTSASFSRLVRLPTEPATPSPIPPTTPRTTKGKPRATEANTAQEPEAADVVEVEDVPSGDPEHPNTPLRPGSMIATLRSASIQNDTGRTNIPAIKQDVRSLAEYIDRELRSQTSQQQALESSLLQLTKAVTALGEQKAHATLSHQPPQKLADRVEQLAQHFERLDDQRGAEVSDLYQRTEALQDDSNTIINDLSGLKTMLTDVQGSVAAVAAAISASGASRPVSTTPTRRARSRSPQPGPSSPTRYRNSRPYDTRPAPKRARGLAPLQLSTPLVTTNAGTSTTVRFGAIAWSSQFDRRQNEVRATAKAAWDYLGADSFSQLRSIELDPNDEAFILLDFPSPAMAHAFVDAWVQNKHKTPQVQKARAELA
ncbi:hypothetical protein GY45DRAFT_1323690 [Cubamyces sp. BRFM 1775]|nr:hypothetical protein GY45DRAFT_1323690 [Cubamyces sp. BRFM 1775]